MNKQVMMSRGIRGAITVDENSAEAVKSAVVELLTEMLEKNSIEKEKISHVLFSMTKDLNAAFPAKFAREETGFDEIPMECFCELDVKGALAKCLRVMMVVNTEKKHHEINHVYLKGASVLRQDLKQ